MVRSNSDMPRLSATITTQKSGRPFIKNKYMLAFKLNNNRG